MCIEGTEKMDADDARKYFFVFGMIDESIWINEFEAFVCFFFFYPFRDNSHYSGHIFMLSGSMGA